MTMVQPFGVESISSGLAMPELSRLLVRDGVIGDKSVKFLIDSGVSANLVNPGLALKC